MENIKNIVASAGGVKNENIPFVLNSDEFLSLVERVAGSVYREAVEVEKIDSTDGMDEYELRQTSSKILIKATSGSAAASAFNRYLKEYCNYTVGALFSSGKLPEKPPKVNSVIREKSQFHYRYLYNYCTFGYTYPFYKWEDWERVLDWALLSGYNLILNPIGQEMVWYKLLINLGYKDKEAKKFLVAPAFMPWFLMSNMSDYNGSYSESYLKRQWEISGKFNKRLQPFGVGIVFPAYIGMVPNDYGERFPGSAISDQGYWEGLKRPSFLLPEDKSFCKIADMFYKIQASIDGGENVHYYSADPFHEGGVTDGINLEKYGVGVYNCMKHHDKNAVWFLQGWQDNPKRDMIKSLDKSHVLVANLLAETNFNAGDNFADSPWMYCTVVNFGAQHSLKGKIKNLLSRPYVGINNKKYTMVGIGVMPEAVETDEVLFDVISSINIKSEEIDADYYLMDFIKRRYGILNDELLGIWKDLRDYIYENDTIESSTASAFLCRPSLTADRVSVYSDRVEIIDNTKLLNVVKTLVKYYEVLKDNEAYKYDLIDFSRQLMANESWKLVYGLQEAYIKGNKEDFYKYSQKFLSRFDLMDELLSNHKNFLLGTWLNRAIQKGETDDEKRWLEWNARTIITVWAPRAGDDLHDYSAREYQGMIKDFYKPRWESFISKLSLSLYTGEPIDETCAYDSESLFAYERKLYPTVENNTLKESVNKIIEEVINDR